MFEGFILAGGRSTRMGRDKAFLEFDGETFLDRARAILEGVCGNVSVVLNQDQRFVTGIPVVRDEFEGRGALGGLHAALKSCQTQIAIVLAVDLPRVTPESVRNLADLAASFSKYLAVVPRQTDGRTQPLFAAYRARFCVPVIERLINENPTASARDFLDLIGPKYIDQSKLSDDVNLLLNVNSPEDLIHTMNPHD
jgi:molybdopterin-guanine dinucleotide biosynthesis protein A